MSQPNVKLAEAGTIRDKTRKEIEQAAEILAAAKEALAWSKTRRRPRIMITAEGEDKPVKA